MSDSYKFEKICKNIVINYYKEKGIDLKIEDVYVVWLCKTLQNSKALLGTNIVDGKYFEVTYNGSRDEIYFDVYNKEKNVLIPSSEFDSEVHE